MFVKEFCFKGDRGMKSRMMARCGLFVALMSLCAWIGVGAPVAFTFQTFAVALSLLLLGGKWGCVSVCAYLLLGAVGVPVFSSFRGGIGMLLGPTGGYLWGFLITALVYWLITATMKKTFAPILGLVLGLIGLYTVGTAWYAIFFGAGWIGILSTCVAPFVLPDLGKLLLALSLYKRLQQYT